MFITEQREELDRLFASLAPLTRHGIPLTVLIDGGMNSGKSPLAQLVAERIGGTVIQLDDVFPPSEPGGGEHYGELAEAVELAHAEGKHAVVSGIVALHRFYNARLAPDFMVYIEAPNTQGNDVWRDFYARYERQYCPRDMAHFVFNRVVPTTAAH